VDSGCRILHESPAAVHPPPRCALVGDVFNVGLNVYISDQWLMLRRRLSSTVTGEIEETITPLPRIYHHRRL
jgi:hypothetical protein